MLKRAIDDLDCSLHPNWACEQDRRRMAERSTTRSQMPLFDVAGNGLDQGYMNLRDGDSAEERHIVATLERMWQRFEPFADLDFRQGFARDPDGRFWEMYLACALLDTDKVLLARADYPAFRTSVSSKAIVASGSRRSRRLPVAARTRCPSLSL